MASELLRVPDTKPEFHPRDPHGERKEPALPSSQAVLWLPPRRHGMHELTHIHTSIRTVTEQTQTFSPKHLAITNGEEIRSERKLRSVRLKRRSAYLQV